MSLCSFTSALDVRPPWSLGWGRCGVCNCCSQPQQECPEGCGPSLPRWDRAAPSVVATEVSMQAQLTGCFVLGRALPRTGESRSRGCSDTRAALPGFSAAFYSAPAFCTGQDGGRAASPSWLGKDTGDEADGCILLPGSGSSLGLVFLGDCGAYTALAPLQAPPRDPKAGVGSQTPEGSYGVGLSQLRSLWAASPEQGFLLLAAIFQALCCGCTNLEFGRSCRLLSGAFPRCSSENASREGKGLIVLLTCPCLNNAACKNIISIYTALLPACRPGPVIPYLTNSSILHH